MHKHKHGSSMLQRKSDESHSHKFDDCTNKCFTAMDACYADSEDVWECDEKMEKCMSGCDITPPGEDEVSTNENNEGPPGSMLQEKATCFHAHGQCIASSSGNCARSLYQCMHKHKHGSSMLQRKPDESHSHKF